MHLVLEESIKLASYIWGTWYDSFVYWSGDWGWLGARFLREAHERRALLRMSVSNDLLKVEAELTDYIPKKRSGSVVLFMLVLWWWFEKNLLAWGAN